jgi:hypothetical protein
LFNPPDTKLLGGVITTEGPNVPPLIVSAIDSAPEAGMAVPTAVQEPLAVQDTPVNTEPAGVVGTTDWPNEPSDSDVDAVAE